MNHAQPALVVTPHPLTVQGQQVLSAQQAALVPGETLAAFLARHGVQPGQQWAVSVGGVDVPEAMWGRVRPKDGHLIECRRLAHKDVLRLVASFALGWFTFGAGGMASLSGTGFLGLGTGVPGWLAAGATYVAGSMLINKVLGPKPLSRESNSVSPTYSLQGGRNRARLWEPMGLVLGEPYCVPDLAAQPYTYFENGEQFLWQLFHAGLNCAEVSSIRIGQTAIEDYQSVSLHRAGFLTGNTGLPALAQSVDTVAGALLDAPTAPGAYTTRTSSLNTMHLAVDLECSLFAVSSSGKYEAKTVSIDLEYRAVGSGTWLPFVDGAATQELSNASTKPLRTTFKREVAAGQYEVRARKNDANTTDTQSQNVVQWSTLKSYQDASADYSGQAALGVQIQASGQLNGSLDEVNWRAKALPVPYWNGSAWVTATDRASGLCNPGAILLLLARGVRDGSDNVLAGLGFEDEQIDIESLQGFMVWCAAKGFHFDYFLQENTSAQDLLDAVAAAGMGAISWHTGKLGVIWFSDDQPIESVLNMAAIKAKSFSVTYDTGTTADELEVQYFDRSRGDTWQSLRVLAPGVTTPTQTARVPLTGVTSEAQAAILARFLMAQNVYQRKTVALDVDLEHLTFRRGTLMAVSHDVTQWGYGGRVQAAVNVAGAITVTLDDEIPAGSGSRYMGFRLPGEQQYRIFPVNAFSGSSRVVTVTGWPFGVPVPGDSASNPAHDTLWIYDFKSTPGARLRVADISPVGNLDGAKVALVPDSPEMWTYIWTGDYTPPPTDSLLSQGAPVLSGVTITEQRVRVGTAYLVDVTLSFSISGAYARTELYGSLDGAAAQWLGTTSNTQVTFRAEMGQAWSLELRPYSSLHAGAPVTTSHTVGSTLAGPACYDTFSVSTRADGTRVFTFEYTTTPRPANLLGAVVRFLTGTHTTPAWGSMYELHTGALPNSPIETQAGAAGAYTFALRAMDTDGVLSDTIRYVNVTLPALATGAAAELLTISANGSTMNFTSAGVAYPAAQSIDFEALLQNLTGTVTWAAEAFNESGVSQGAVTLDVSGNTCSLTSANFIADPDTQFVVISATLGSHTAYARVIRLTDGGEPILSLILPQTITLPASPEGVVSSWASATAAFVVTVGQTVVTSGVTYSLAPGGNPSGLTHTISSTTGSISVTAAGTWPDASNEATLTFRATHDATGLYRDVPLKITKARAGVAAIRAELSKPAHVFPASVAGVVSSYAGSGTTLRVYEGNTELVYDGVGTAASRWTFSTTTSNITRGTITDSGDYATIGDASGVADGTDVSSITYSITGKRASGAAFTASIVQAFSKSKTGATGATGATGPTGATGAAGAAGTRGSRTIEDVNAAYTASYNNGAGAGAASYKAQATALIAAATSGLTPTTPVKGDAVAMTNGSNYVSSWINDGTYGTNGNNSWVSRTTVIDGSWVVQGTLAADKLSSGTYTMTSGTGYLALGDSGFLMQAVRPNSGAVNTNPLVYIYDQYASISTGPALQVISSYGRAIYSSVSGANATDAPYEFVDGFTLVTGDFMKIRSYRNGLRVQNSYYGTDFKAATPNYGAEVTGGIKVTGTFGVNNATPQAKYTLPAAATDAATTQALANSIRTALINCGIAQ